MSDYEKGFVAGVEAADAAVEEVCGGLAAALATEGRADSGQAIYLLARTLRSRLRSLTPTATTGERPPAEPSGDGTRLGRELAKMERTNPAVARARRNIDQVTADIIGRPAGDAEPSGATCKTCGGTGVVMIQRGPVVASPGPCPDCATPSPARPSEAACVTCGGVGSVRDNYVEVAGHSEWCSDCGGMGRTGAR